jgi:lipopolysaccharide cholinephosphotransferase
MRDGDDALEDELVDPPVLKDEPAQVVNDELRGIQLIELGILQELDRLCQKHGLRYYLAYGTLLGAVRHRGFIPWDDDIDVTMPRSDYNRLAEICLSELPSEMRWQSYKTDRHYPLMFGKILRVDTVMRHALSKDLRFQQSVYIDIFPIDGIARNSVVALVQRFIVRICRIRLSVAMSRVRFKRQLVQFIRIIPRGFVVRVLEATTGLVPPDKSGRWVCFGGPYGFDRQSFPSTWFGSGTTQVFENLQFVGPLEWNKYLAQLYGDYMTPPPVSARLSHHNITEVRLGAREDGAAG